MVVSRKKDSSEILLRALDGEDIQLDGELSELVQLGNRVRAAAPELPHLKEDARRRIWDETVSDHSLTEVQVKPARRVPRLALGIAAGLALALIAALVLIFVNVGESPVPEEGGIAELRIHHGDITVLSSGGEERPAEDGEALMEGDTIIASEDSRGIVEFEEGCILRLDGEAEVSLSSQEGELVADVIKGKSYHRVVDGTSYVVRSGGIKVTAKGTAFTFDVEEYTGKVISLHDAVKVDVTQDSVLNWSSRLEEGKVFLYREGEEEAYVAEISREELDNEWLLWNKSLDEDLGLPLGALSMLDSEIAVGEPQEQPQEQPQPQPEPPGDGQPTPPPATEQPPTGEPPPATGPPPTPGPTPPPPPPAQGSVALSAAAAEGRVDFSWTVTGYSGFQGFKLCRSETNPYPSYPNDWWKYIDGEAARSTTDTSVKPGQTYYYRLAVYDQGNVLGYSNPVQVTVPGQPEGLSISLNAVMDGGKVVLSWVVSGQGDYSGFKVCRSETNPNPSYPAEGLVFVAYGQNGYTDTSVQPGKTYYYRVGIYKDGSILKYSNAVQVTMP
jgi:hypothetical protein